MSSFFFHQTSIRDPYTQIAWEESLALSMRKFGMKLGVRLWRNQSCLVLGISERENETISHSYLQSFRENYNSVLYNPLVLNPCRKFFPKIDNAWIARRASGGGTVFQNETDNLNFSLFVDISDRQDLYPVQKSYDTLLGIAIQALKSQGLQLQTAGKSDISLMGADGILRKVSGNAQFRKKDIIVQHGTLILNANLFQNIEKFQLHPPEEPEYRAKRSHRDFLTPLPIQLDPEKLGKEILKYLQIECKLSQTESNSSKNTFNFLKESLILRKKLMLEKYSQAGWIWKSDL